MDAECFYAITNRAIGKYRKDTGERVAGWEDEKGGHLKHLNAGVVFEGKLYCAHSNFPDRPEQSSVEIWDTATLRHIDSHHFENPPGSLTWVDRRDGRWFACFAHYRKTSDPALSRVMSFDADWKPLQSWTFPAALIERFGGNSASGGSLGPGGNLFVTGHDARGLYVLGVPEAGGELIWRDTIAISAAATCCVLGSDCTTSSPWQYRPLNSPATAASNMLGMRRPGSGLMLTPQAASKAPRTVLSDTWR